MEMAISTHAHARAGSLTGRTSGRPPPSTTIVSTSTWSCSSPPPAGLSIHAWPDKFSRHAGRPPSTGGFRDSCLVKRDQFGLLSACGVFLQETSPFSSMKNWLDEVLQMVQIRRDRANTAVPSELLRSEASTPVRRRVLRSEQTTAHPEAGCDQNPPIAVLHFVLRSLRFFSTVSLLLANQEIPARSQTSRTTGADLPNAVDWYLLLNDIQEPPLRMSPSGDRP